YIIVMDTVIEDLATGSFPDRPWGKGNNPKTAALEFVKNNGRFEIDRAMSDKLLISACPDGFIKCVKDRP
ncbi:MAG: CmcI family methyltransferase, partial [Thermodesulfobacteriota bacterium]|nr:CmcI family methyltransferase [Thermodesulfobacteriota bacterium]